MSNSLQVTWQYYISTPHPRGSNTPTEEKEEEGNADVTHSGSWGSRRSLELLSLREK